MSNNDIDNKGVEATTEATTEVKITEATTEVKITEATTEATTEEATEEEHVDEFFWDDKFQPSMLNKKICESITKKGTYGSVVYQACDSLDKIDKDTSFNLESLEHFVNFQEELNCEKEMFTNGGLYCSKTEYKKAYDTTILSIIKSYSSDVFVWDFIESVQSLFSNEKMKEHIAYCLLFSLSYVICDDKGNYTTENVDFKKH